MSISEAPISDIGISDDPPTTVVVSSYQPYQPWQQLAPMMAQ